MGQASRPVFDRVLIKLSGEALMGQRDFGTDPDEVGRIASEIADLVDRRVEVAVVVGGGNIYRGIDGTTGGVDRATGDDMGMMATLLNALTLQDALASRGRFTRVLSAIDVREVAEPYIRR
ncbi:MAG: UMP kinase, partial [Solirubrobacterales bacterium]